LRDLLKASAIVISALAVLVLLYFPYNVDQPPNAAEIEKTVNSIDVHEAMLWFATRGDECLNCAGAVESLFMDFGPLIIRVHK